MSVKIEIDDTMVQRAFDGLTPKQLRTATKQGLRRAVNVIKREAVKNYKSAYPDSSRHKYIHMKVYRSGIGAMVDLLFLKKDKEARPYVMRFQNKGTAMRATKAGYDRGFMPASEFFAEAVRSKKAQAESMLMRSVREAVVKKARKEGLV